MLLLLSLALLTAADTLTPASIAGTSRFGPEFRLGPPAAGVYVAEAETNFRVPAVPSPQRAELLLWAGVPADGVAAKGEQWNRAQGGVISTDKAVCPGNSGRWCAGVRTMNGAKALGPSVAIEQGAFLNFRYLYDEATGTSITILRRGGSAGKVLSSLSEQIGHGMKFQTAVECHDYCSGLIGQHVYTNSTIRLSAPDLSFGEKIYAHGTWRVQTVTMEVANFPAIIVQLKLSVGGEERRGDVPHGRTWRVQTVTEEVANFPAVIFCAADN
ncbi:hypothetical protein EJ06DRAFT_517982 [Trichodelitschia bisporula]|uniref:Concanavalin A-like lectin/glucanase n=1 Tax=Trichodelitschia bisporula TaxID=703511 RepID=A0A6G1I9V5_9PEZI|nr:hypothetical protein EJ06DRAFT_517982 [Trichodelitschia bisporula]